MAGKVHFSKRFDCPSLLRVSGCHFICVVTGSALSSLAYQLLFWSESLPCFSGEGKALKSPSPASRQITHFWDFLFPRCIYFGLFVCLFVCFCLFVYIWNARIYVEVPCFVLRVSCQIKVELPESFKVFSNSGLSPIFPSASSLFNSLLTAFCSDPINWEFFAENKITPLY